MDGKIILAIAGSFLGGSVAGFILGYTYFKSKETTTTMTVKRPESPNQNTPVHIENKTEKKEFTPVVKDIPIGNDPSKIVSTGPAKIATEDSPGVDYTDYVKKVEEQKYKAESEAPTDGDDLELTEEEDEEIEEKMETYADRTMREQQMINDELDKFTQKNGNRIQILGNKPIDPEWPDIHYEEEEIFYFIPDDILTDGFGTVLDKLETVGPDLARWYHNPHEFIWVRNNFMNKDFKITKIDDDYESYWGLKSEE